MGYFDSKTKKHPPPGDDASTAEAAPGRVGRDEQGVDLISSSGVYGSKAGLNVTSPLLRRHGQHIYTYIYTVRNTTNTTRASPRQADARLGSAHARNGQGRRQIEAVDATSTAKYCI